MNLPFPINSLTVLALVVFLYLALAILFLGDLMGMPKDQAGGLMIAAKVALVRPMTIGVTVWLTQRHAFFRRGPGDPLRFFSHVVNGLIAAAVAAGISLSFHLGEADPLASLGSDLPLILITFMLCAAVALCCDDWARDTTPPLWLRFAEAGGCALVMVLGMGMVYFYLRNKLPFPADSLSALKIALLIGFPARRPSSSAAMCRTSTALRAAPRRRGAMRRNSLRSRLRRALHRLAVLPQKSSSRS